MKQKMLYVSHVDWRWIKQRPHFIAEGLMEHFDVTVLYTFQNANRKQLQKRDVDSTRIHPFYSIPMSGRIKPLGVIDRVFMRAQLAHQIRKVRPDYLYLTYPTQVTYLPDSFSGKLLYDCMDDHVAMMRPELKESLLEKERELIRRADVVLVSSENLRQVLICRYGAEYAEKMHLVRNGYSGKILETEENARPESEEFAISYVGTIGKWFNLDFLVKSLEEFPNLRYQIIGPVEVEKPQHDRLVFVGTLEHHKLYDAVKQTQCLTMPFVVNDIVASVDPVKLYEYINYNKNILCVYYPEIQRFAPFVHFYEDYESFSGQIRRMMADNQVKYDNETRVNFLKENSWDSRVNSIVQILK